MSAHAAHPRVLSKMRRMLSPLARQYIRQTHFTAGKDWLCDRFVSRSVTAPKCFSVSTDFGSIINGSTRDLIERYIYFTGVWEPGLTQWLTKTLKPGDTFVDIGANIGYFSLLASKLVGELGGVVAIEPLPSTTAILRRNLALNRCANVRVIEEAVSDRSGRVAIYPGPAQHTGLSSIRPGSELCAAITVQTAPLADMLLPRDFERCRVVKIDVEGAEQTVLPDVLKLIDRFRKEMEICVEIAPQRWSNDGMPIKELMTAIASCGLYAYELENNYDPKSYLRQKTIFPRRIQGEITKQTDVILSRCEAQYLAG